MRGRKYRGRDTRSAQMGRTYLLASLDLHDLQVALGVDDICEDVALLFVGNPEHLLAVVRHGLIFSLLLKRNEQVLGGIGIDSGHFGVFANSASKDN